MTAKTANQDLKKRSLKKTVARVNGKQQSGWFDWRGALGLEKARLGLTKQAQSGRLPQVNLIVGPSGAGKRHLVAWLLESLFCETSDGFTGEPCGHCSGCIEVTTLEHKDLVITDPRSSNLKSIKTNELLDFQKFFEVHGYGGRRVGVIFDADLMTIEAQNRLLKLLEEPPEGSLIWLTTSKPQHLLRTLKSRCTKVMLRVSVDKPLILSKLSEDLALTQSDQEYLAESLQLLSGSPGSWFKILNSRADWERWKQLQTSIDRLLEDSCSLKSQTEMIDMLVKSQKYSVSELASAVELRLNLRYKFKDCSNISGASIRVRRESLSLIRKAQTMKIAINLPMAFTRVFGKFEQPRVD